MISVGIQDQGGKSDNFSKVINITASQLSGIGSLEDQICEYINSLKINKKDVDADIWIEYDPAVYKWIGSEPYCETSNIE